MAKRVLLQAHQKETFGQRLARLRKTRGLSQEDLAARLKVSQSNVSDYERDNLRLHADIIVELTKILDVSADEFLGIDEADRKPSSIRDHRLAQRLGQIEQLPKRDRDALMRTVSAYLDRASSRRAA